MELRELVEQELERARELLSLYQSIGPSGLYGSLVIRQTIARSEKALESDDTVEWAEALGELKRLE